MLRRCSDVSGLWPAGTDDNLVGPEAAPGVSPSAWLALDPLPRRVAPQVTLLDFFAGTEPSAVHHRPEVFRVDTHPVFVLLLRHGQPFQEVMGPGFWPRMSTGSGRIVTGPPNWSLFPWSLDGHLIQCIFPDEP